MLRYSMLGPPLESPTSAKKTWNTVQTECQLSLTQNFDRAVHTLYFMRARLQLEQLMQLSKVYQFCKDYY
jgi:hypothetical protein